MLTTIINAVIQTPWWVYLVFIYLIQVGIRSSKGGTVSMTKLAILPILFIVMSIHTLIASFQLSGIVISVWLCSIILGVWIGWQLVCRQKIQVDKTHWLIKLPGTWLTLILVMIIFISKYYFGYQLSADPRLMHQHGFEFSMLAVSGLCTGMFAGRVLLYFRKLYAEPSTDLKNE